MLNKKIEAALNEQINAEIWSAYLYLSMSTYLASNDFMGMEKWMRIQYEEELTHALRIIDYITNKGGNVALKPIGKVPTSWKNIVDVFEDSLNHEQAVTKSIDKLVALAIEENDYATRSMLDWFVNEQVEEESNFTYIVKKLKMVKDNPTGVCMVDKELGDRSK